MSTIRLSEVRSLSDFQRHARHHIARLRKTGLPEVLTVNGKAALVVQDADSYQKLLDLIDEAQAIAGIRRGLEDVRAGRTRPASESLRQLRRDLKIRPRR